MSRETQYLLLVVGLFIVPRLLLRYRLPGAVTCLGIGAIAGMGLDAFHGDTTIPLLAVLGIVSLFLFAGLEVEFSDLRKGARIIGQHIAIQSALLLVSSVLVRWGLGLEWRASVLLALALVTPSTGFILDSLGGFGLDDQQVFWVKSKAIAVELVALAVLFAVVRSESASQLGLAAVALVTMILVLPVAFRVFAVGVLPHAPRSEFAFLVVLALVCASITRQLGVYYLVGAFVVGLVAQRSRRVLPGIASAKVLQAIELFASFFIPFYFFRAGLHLAPEDFSLHAVALGLGAVVVLVPLRILLVALHRHRALGAPLRTTARVGAAMVPTLVFTIVVADILREQFGLPPHLYGALIVYTVVNTVLPGFLLRTPPPEFAAPTVVDEPRAG